MVALKVLHMSYGYGLHSSQAPRHTCASPPSRLSGAICGLVMDFELNEEQKLFRTSIVRFLADEYGFNKRQAIVATDAGFLESHWQTFAELGWLGAPFPEADGGLGGSAVETMLLMEQFGRALVVSPYLSSIVLAGHLIQFGGSEEQKRTLLCEVIEGRRKLAFAFTEPQARYELANVATIAAANGDDFLIDGAKCVVLFANATEQVIVSARTAGAQNETQGISLFVVDMDSPGLHAEHYTTHDGGRASELRLHKVRVKKEACLGPLDEGFSLIEKAVDYGTAAVCAEACGAMWSIYEQTLEYVKTRKQFGQPLGSFQVLQHRLVDVYMKCELAQSMVYEATLNLDRDDGARRRSTSAAKYLIGQYARVVGEEGVQLHGGVGMAMDVPIGHYLKRLTLINASFGDSGHHLARYCSR